MDSLKHAAYPLEPVQDFLINLAMKRNRSTIKQHFSINTYHYTRPQNWQQSLRSLKKFRHINPSCWSSQLWILLKLKSYVHFNARFDFHVKSLFLWFLKNFVIKKLTLNCVIISKIIFSSSIGPKITVFNPF